MIDSGTIGKAVNALVAAAPNAEQIVLFGSYANGLPDEGSDLDFLVIESEVTNRANEMVRLRRALRPLRIPVDILVYSRAEVTQWGQETGTALYWALKEGQVAHG